MVKRYLSLLLTLTMCLSLFANNDSDSIPKEKEPVQKEMFYGPTVGLGVGMFKFYKTWLSDP